MESLSKAEDEDEYKNDTDPQGFFTYKKLVSIGWYHGFYLAGVAVDRHITDVFRDCLRLAGRRA